LLDYLITGRTVVDGTGSALRTADVGAWDGWARCNGWVVFIGKVDEPTVRTAFLTLRAASNRGAFYVHEARQELAGALGDVSGLHRRNSTFALGEAAATVDSGRWRSSVKQAA
jgi:hypothetical protein